MKALGWLRQTSKDPEAQPLAVLGRIIEAYMDQPLDPWMLSYESLLKARERITRVLAECSLQYLRGGTIVGALGAPSRTLEQYTAEREVGAVEAEFNRALSNVESNPREAVSAASNILESLCKVYIAEEGLEVPAKQDLKPVWSVVRKHLGFDPSGSRIRTCRRFSPG